MLTPQSVDRHARTLLREAKYKLEAGDTRGALEIVNHVLASTEIVNHVLASTEPVVPASPPEPEPVAPFAASLINKGD